MSRFKKGFSLIEVMVTLAIIAVVTSVVMPNFQSIQNKSKRNGIKIDRSIVTNFVRGLSI